MVFLHFREGSQAIPWRSNVVCTKKNLGGSVKRQKCSFGHKGLKINDLETRWFTVVWHFKEASLKVLVRLRVIYPKSPKWSAGPQKKVKISFWQEKDQNYQVQENMMDLHPFFFFPFFRSTRQKGFLISLAGIRSYLPKKSIMAWKLAVKLQKRLSSLEKAQNSSSKGQMM